MEHNDKEYKRVTETLAPFSGINSIPKEILKPAQERGTAVHEYCDKAIKGIEAIDVNEDWRGYLNSFLLWEKEKNFLPKPDRLFCDKYNLTGEIDGLYRDGQDIVLFDIKTPIKECKTWEFQLSAYAYLLSLSGVIISKICSVKLEKSGDEPKVSWYKIDVEGYLQLLDIYNRFFKKRKDDDLYLDYL